MAAAEGDDVRVANTTINCRILYVGKEERGVASTWAALGSNGPKGGGSNHPALESQIPL